MVVDEATAPEPLDPLAERALEVLVTHNEAVTREDLACALGVSGVQAWEVATTLHARGYAALDEAQATATAIDPGDLRPNVRAG